MLSISRPIVSCDIHGDVCLEDEGKGKLREKLSFHINKFSRDFASVGRVFASFYGPLGDDVAGSGLD